MNITVFGTGYVGLVTGACLANQGHSVLCMDVDKKKIADIKTGKLPFYEPKLQEYVKENTKKGRLVFTTDPKEAVTFGTVILNCVGTPGKEDGSANLEYIFAVAKTIAAYIERYKVIVTKSTVPPGTARQLDALIKKLNPKAEYDIVSNPEFLKEGAAVDDCDNPDRIVIGLKEKSQQARKEIGEMYAHFIKKGTPIVYTNWETAELIKYACNTFLATKISFINEMANICDRLGADVTTVAKAMGFDARIGAKFLNAGVGYGGSCFPKDVRALSHTAQQLNYIPGIITYVDSFNERQKSIITDKIKKSMVKIKGKTIAVWGLSFKPETSDMRDAPSITIINELTKEGATVKVYDPEAHEEAKKVLENRVLYCSTAEEAAAGADALILVTEWEEFRSKDMLSIKKSMKGNKLFDGRNLFDPAAMKKAGFDYQGMGRQ